MIHALPYRLIGKTNLESFTTAANLVLRDWADDWLSEGTASSIGIVGAEQTDCQPRKGASWRLLGSAPDNWVACEAKQDTLTRWADVLIPGLGVAASRASVLMPAVIEECLQDLLARFLAADDLGESITEPDDSYRTGDGSGAISFSLAAPLGNVPFVVGGDVAERMVQRVAPDRLASHEPLVSRSAAIGRGRLEIRVHLGTAVLSLGELAQLSPGDVIVLDEKISEPLRVHSRGGKKIASARLGQRGSKKAIQIEMD